MKSPRRDIPSGAFPLPHDATLVLSSLEHMVIEFADYSDIVARLQAVKEPSIVELKDRLYGAARVFETDPGNLSTQQAMTYIPERMFPILRQHETQDVRVF